MGFAMDVGVTLYRNVASFGGTRHDLDQPRAGASSGCYRVLCRKEHVIHAAS
jgi:hypothetical protein